MTRTTAAILASAAMTPIGAQAAERQASPLAESEQLGGSEPISIIAIVVGLAAAIAVAIVVLDDDDDEEPASP